ncbi:MAG: CDP-diacylglycerol--serine O-phosphatidyltransferase [Alphaproteobacteria bacterium]
MARKKKRKGERADSLTKMIPNMLTTMAFVFGLSGILFAYHQKWEYSVLSIVFAAFLDGIDGRVARALNAQTKFGAEFDSLSDCVSFGVVPGVVLFMWTLHEVPRFGWLVAVAFAVCNALRLARFNTKMNASDDRPFAANFFEGMPAPAGACMALLPMALDFGFFGGGVVSQYPYLVLLWTGLAAFMMVSTVPTVSFKKVHIPPRFKVPFMLAAALLVVMVLPLPRLHPGAGPGFHWKTLSFIGFVYLACIPWGLLRYRKMNAEWLASQSGGSGDEPPTSTDKAEVVEDAGQDVRDTRSDTGSDTGTDSGDDREGKTVH